MGPYIRTQPTSNLNEGREWDWMYQSFTISADEPMYLDYTLDEDVLYVFFERCPGPDEHPTEPPSVEGGDPFAHALMTPKVGGYGIPFISSAGTWRVDVVRSHGAPISTELSFWKGADPW